MMQKYDDEQKMFVLHVRHDSFHFVAFASFVCVWAFMENYDVFSDYIMTALKNTYNTL